MHAYRLAYDGTAYRGFQRQPHGETVEDALFEALRRLEVLPAEAEAPQGYAAAGRTDTGVSARAQTVAFEALDWLRPRALNGELPAPIRAWASATVPEGFHATHDAAWRAYTYFLHAPNADEERARAALAAVEGTHDFANLTPDSGDTTRTVLGTDLERDGEFLAVIVRADGFCRAMVRRIATLVGEVATGEAGMDRVERVLDPTPLPGPAGVASAPAEPLVLTDVGYPNVEFEVDEAAAASAREVFADLRIAAATRTRVTAAVLEGIGGVDEA